MSVKSLKDSFAIYAIEIFNADELPTDNNYVIINEIGKIAEGIDDIISGQAVSLEGLGTLNKSLSSFGRCQLHRIIKSLQSFV